VIPITLSAWKAADKLGVGEHAMHNLSDCLPHIVLANERLFPRAYIEACVHFLQEYELTAARDNLLLFRDMGETVAIIREAQQALDSAFRSDPAETRENQELGNKAIASILGVAEPTVDRWRAQGYLARKGKIPKIKLKTSYKWVFK
jgi:hypothetical protein